MLWRIFSAQLHMYMPCDCILPARMPEDFPCSVLLDRLVNTAFGPALSVFVPEPWTLSFT